MKLSGVQEQRIRDTEIIEKTIEAFGISSRVVSVDTEDDSNVFALDIAPGVRVEDVEALSRTLAMRLALPSNDLVMIVPLVGRPLIGIRLPKKGHSTPSQSDF